MYAATGESAMPSSARPLEIARLAPFWSGIDLDVDLALLGLALRVLLLRGALLDRDRVVAEIGEASSASTLPSAAE